VVYFIQPARGGPIKIGTTGDLELRLRQLDADYGLTWAVLGTTPGGVEEERALHGRFAHLRLGRTEQFRPARELLEFIGRPLLVGANPDAVEVLAPLVGRVAIPGTPEWIKWLEEAAEHCRLDTSKLLDIAVASYAAQQGFPKRPPPRI
jgi:hypothetical protein